MSHVDLVRVFPLSKSGGNPAPTVLNAESMSSKDMQMIAEKYGLESGFVFPPDPNSNAHYHFRFFVPEHEMEMCGHATIAALWLLRDKQQIQNNIVLIDTLSGQVRAQVPDSGAISVSQPVGEIKPLSVTQCNAVRNVLCIEPSDMQQTEMFNASTSRVKTLIALRDRETLNSLTPDFEKMNQLCTDIGSTGLYPFAAGVQPGMFHARQFPRASGYPEDAATGIAASALAFGLLKWGLVAPTEKVIIRQGEAMGQASEIAVTLAIENGLPTGCWIHGDCQAESNRDTNKNTGH